MFAKLTVLVSLVVLPFVAAQDVGIKAIEAHFQQAHLVQDYLKEFAPSAVLTLNYEGVGDIEPGQALTIPQVRPQPTVRINSTEPLTGVYTIAMVDLDVVGTDAPEVNRHWLLNGVTVADGIVSDASATAITTYAGPGPAAGSGSHRYVVALYQQPEGFTAPEGLNEPIGVTPMDWNTYAANLGPLVAANYINVEEGTYTGTPIATSAVVSSTLAPAAESSPAASGSGTGASQSVKSSASGASSSEGAEPTNDDEDGSAARLTAWAAPVVALIGGIAVAAL